MKFSSILNKLVKKTTTTLLPEEEESGSISNGLVNGVVAPRQRVLNKLREQFMTEMANETTTESLLYHTSYTVYIREAEYERLAPSFAQTVRDAINVFIRELKKMVREFPDYVNHSKYWQLQLVAIPDDAEIDGISSEELEDEPILIKSKLFAEDAYDSNYVEDENCVVTLHTKDSSKQLPKAFNLAALKGLTELAKDKYRVEFNLDDEIKNNPRSEAERNMELSSYYATLNIVDGTFIKGDKKYRVYKMDSDKLYVSGKNGAYKDDAPEININDENILSPTLEINRKPDGSFTVKVRGDVRISGKRVESGMTVPLYNNSQILIDGEYPINFTIA